MELVTLSFDVLIMQVCSLWYFQSTVTNSEDWIIIFLWISADFVSEAGWPWLTKRYSMSPSSISTLYAAGLLVCYVYFSIRTIISMTLSVICPVLCRLLVISSSCSSSKWTSRFSRGKFVAKLNFYWFRVTSMQGTHGQTDGRTDRKQRFMPHCAHSPHSTYTAWQHTKLSSVIVWPHSM